MSSRIILTALIFLLTVINSAFAIDFCVEGAGDTQFNGTYSGTDGASIFQKGSDSVYLRNISNSFWALSLTNSSPFYGYVSSTFAASPAGLTYSAQSTFGPAPTIRLGNCSDPTPTVTPSPTVTSAASATPSPSATPSATPAGQLPEKLCLKLYQGGSAALAVFAKFAGTYTRQTNGEYTPDSGVRSSIKSFNSTSWLFSVNNNAIVITRSSPVGRYDLMKGVDFDAEAGACTASNPPAGSTPPSNVSGITACARQSGSSNCATNAAAAIGVTTTTNTRGASAANLVFVPQQIVPVQSDADGSFSFGGIAPGDYEVHLVGDGLLFNPDTALISVLEGVIATIPAPIVSQELYAESGCKKSSKRQQILSVYDSVLELKRFLSNEYGASGLIALDRLSETESQAYLDKLTPIKDAGENQAGNLLANLFQMPLVVRSGCAKSNQCTTAKLSPSLNQMRKGIGALTRSGNKLLSASAKKFKTKADIKRVAKQRKKLAKLAAKSRKLIAKLPSKNQSCPKLN